MSVSAAGRERFDADAIADLQLVRPRELLARAAIVDRHHGRLRARDTRARAACGRGRRIRPARIPARESCRGHPSRLRRNRRRPRYRRPKSDTVPPGPSTWQSCKLGSTTLAGDTPACIFVFALCSADLSRSPRAFRLHHIANCNLQSTIRKIHTRPRRRTPSPRAAVPSVLSKSLSYGC